MSHCIIKYAQKKCEQTSIEDVSEFIAPWETCPNCLQNYQNDLAVYIADAFVSFAKKEYGYPGNQLDDKMKFMEALRLQIQTNLSAAANGPITREVMEARYMIENLIHKLLAIVDKAKEEHGMGPHMDPTSYEYHQYMCICLLYEAYGYQNLAQLYSVDQSDESTKSEIGYYTRARAIYDEFGYETDSKLMTGNIDRVKAEYGGDKERSLKGKKNIYQNRLESAGQNAEETILTGYNYGIGLMEAYHSIEAERLLTKLAAISRQVYGEDHNCTSKIASLLKKIKMRQVLLACPDSSGTFQALRYENGGEICVVTGPIVDENNERRMFRVESATVLPKSGCPVLCYGLINASHLNGKLGEIRSMSMDSSSGGFRFGVHFEEKGLKPAAVKPENLRIVFELPSV